MDNGFGSTDEAMETCISSQTAVRIALQLLKNVNQLYHHSANLIKAPKSFRISFVMTSYNVTHSKLPCKVI
jgi:hypothetical protein